MNRLPRRGGRRSISSIAALGAVLLISLADASSASTAPTALSPTASAASAASAAQDGRIYFVDGSTGQLVSTTPSGTGRRTYPGPVLRPAISPDGTRIAFETPTLRGIHVENVDGTGDQTLVPDVGGFASWSPDGTRIAFSDGNDIAVVTVATKAVTYLTHDGSATEEVAPAWSPNGSWIAFTQRNCAGGGRCLVRINASNGTGRIVLTPYDGADITTSDEADWSPTNVLTYSSGVSNSCDGAAGIDIWRMGAAGQVKTDLTCNVGVYNSDIAPTWSPSGSRIAFTSDERVDTSSDQLYVMRANGTGLTYVDTGSQFGIADPDWATVPASQATTLTLTAAPTTVATGHRVTLSGTLTPASGQEYAGLAVVITARAAGSTTFSPVRTVRTTAAGTFTTSLVPSASTDYRATYAANPTMGFGASTSPIRTVTVG